MKALVSSAILCLVLSSTCAMASAKRKTFTHTPEQVFEAALQSATEHHVVSFVDEKHLMFTFETGHSMSSWAGFKCNVVIEPKDDGKLAEMVINPQMKESGQKQAFSWGAGGRLADDMFHWTEEKLKVGAAASNVLLDGVKGVLNSLRRVDAAFKVDASQDVISAALIEAQAKFDEFSAASDAKSVPRTVAAMTDSLEAFKQARKNPTPQTLERARATLRLAGELFSSLETEGREPSVAALAN